MDSDELRWTEPNDQPVEGTLVGGAVDPDGAEVEFDPGVKLGRYVVLAHMGSGGMGVVYAAYDPQLDRRIALKLMHQRGDDASQAERASRRMLAEAKAMARLNHPNVISVHDVGTIGQRVFIAMEFVEGVPLSEWMRAPKREWSELLEVFTKAGRGLEAAHAAGLVHRDFKPDNVLVGADGRVRVLDFGLARRVDGERAVGERRDREAGTPAYMSPEQHLGTALDHRADQFSFCVALYEALYGELPFSAKTRLELALAVTDGRVGPAPKRASVPNWIRWALLRGLDPDPEGRWEDMGSLLTALSRDPYHKLRRTIVWSSSAVVALAVVISAIVFVRGREPELVEPAAQCTSASAEIAEVWDDERVAAVRATFAKLDAPWAAQLSSEVETGLDAWARRWEAMHRETCEATAKGTQSDTMLDRRMLCLAKRRAEFGEFVTVLTGAKAETLARAEEAVRKLPSLDSCRAEAIELDEHEPERSEAEKLLLERLERNLYRAHSLEMTGAFDDALPLAKAAVDQARTLEDQGLLATALLTQAQVVMATGSHEAATPLLEEGEFAAERAGADRLRGEILIALGRVDATSRDAEAALRRVREARAVLDRVGAGPVEYAELAGVSALASAAAGQFEQAEREVRGAIASLAEVEPPPVELAQLHGSLGVVLRRLGRYDEARQELGRARELWAGYYGEQHPTIAEILLELARVDAGQGRHESAIVGYEAAISVFEQVFGASSLDVAHASAALAVSLGQLGRYEESLREHQRARAIFRAQGDVAMVELAKVLDAEGVVRRELEQFDEALSLHQQALVILERARGTRGFGAGDLMPVREHLGEVLIVLGRSEEARAHLDLALEQIADGLADAGPEWQPGLEQGRARIAGLRLLAARAWAAGDKADPEHALELARAAREDYLALARADAVAEVDAWMASLDGGD
ncbi:Serine/threonine-protein kinase PK-1 [Enhygromyxa salina]|uniref:Serine/threonine-protein kinase PK-1 n=1 Tax=Enhygromyxa salina TaxID=215803 RepID=A0A2S9YD08_9BACT|nr:serine/threonine-protein kinase [Enhygromyxa salina]PRQ02906.1 Serine/threonine-protein kinase PK-1 [Enhygromyxa salina]